MLFTAKHARELPGVSPIGAAMPAVPMPPLPPLQVWFQDATVEAEIGLVLAPHIASRATSRRPVPPLASYVTSGVTCLMPPMILVAGDTIIRETLTKPKQIERVAEFAHLKRKQSLRLWSEGAPVEAAIDARSRLAGDLFLLTSSLTGNYYHWLVEALPRVALWRQLPDGFRILSRRPYRLFHRQSLAAAGIQEQDLEIISEHTFLEGQVAFADPLVLSTTELSPSIVPFYRALRDEIAPSPKKRRRLLVSRRNAGTRRILNEDAIATALVPLGFEVIESETMAFADQVATFAEAEVIVGAHGAGLANMVFTDPGTIVLELTHSRFRGLSSYDPLAQMFGVTFAVLVGATQLPPDQPEPERGENLDFTVKPEAVVGAVRALTGGA